MEITADLIKILREKTNAGIMDCKQALKEAGGNFEKASEILRKKGIAIAAKKSGRAAKEGIIGSYIHIGSKIGVLVEVTCETDFVARTKSFKDFVKDLTLQIASANPLYISRNEVPPETIEKEREIYRSQITDKPESIKEKIITGKLEKWFSEICLLDQIFVKPPNDKSIKDLLISKIAELGENINIRRFTRYHLGKESIKADAIA